MVTMADKKNMKTTEDQLNELTGMIDDALGKLSETAKVHENARLRNRTQKTLSNLVDDLFRVQKEAKDAVESGRTGDLNLPPLTTEQPKEQGGKPGGDPGQGNNVMPSGGGNIPADHSQHQPGTGNATQNAPHPWRPAGRCPYKPSGYP